MLLRGWYVMLLAEVLPTLARALPSQTCERLRSTCYPYLTSLLARQKEAQVRFYEVHEKLLFTVLQGADSPSFVLDDRDAAESALAAANGTVAEFKAGLFRGSRFTNIASMLTALCLARPEAYALPLFFAACVVAVPAVMLLTIPIMLIVTLPCVPWHYVPKSMSTVLPGPLLSAVARYFMFKNYLLNAMGSVYEHPERVIVYIMTTCMVPFYEELVFRHGVQRFMTSLLPGHAPAIARYASAALFVCLHAANYRLKFLTRPPSDAVRGTLRQIGVTFLNSVLVFSPVYEQKGVWAAAGAHACHNIVATIAVPLLKNLKNVQPGCLRESLLDIAALYGAWALVAWVCGLAPA